MNETFEDREEKLSLLHVPLVYGLRVALLLGHSVPSEEQDDQTLEKMGLVRAENFQLTVDLHPRRPLG